jgi:hypothetical protein
MLSADMFSADFDFEEPRDFVVADVEGAVDFLRCAMMKLLSQMTSVCL